VGPVDHAKRCELLAGAVALVNPVRGIEPFGMVNIESLAMGCPVIGPAFGSFPEILEPGVTGMLCRDLEEYVAAVDWAKGANRSVCRAVAERRFSLDAVWPQYERHFRRIAKVGTKAGWSSRGQWPRDVVCAQQPAACGSTSLRPICTIAPRRRQSRWAWRTSHPSRARIAR
jgi:hypothetical protein